MIIELGAVKRMRDFSEKVSVEEQGRGIEMSFIEILGEKGEKGQVKKVLLFLFMVYNMKLNILVIFRCAVKWH